VSINPLERGEPWTTPARREWVTVVALAAAVVLALVAVSRPDQGLGGDEADNVLRALDFRAGTEPVGDRWGDFRAEGLPFLMSLVPGGSTFGMRLVPILFAGLGVLVVWLLARRLFGPRTAFVAAGLMAVTPGWLTSSWWILADVPGAVIGLAAATVVVYAARGQSITWWAFLAAPLAVAATYVRYGAPLVVSIAIVGVLAARWSTTRRNVLVAGAVVALTCGAMAVVVLVPGATGSTVAPYQANKAVGSTFTFEPLQSFRDFSRQVPEFFGFDAAWDLGRSGVGSVAARVAFVLGSLFVVVVCIGWMVAIGRAARGAHRIEVLAVAVTVVGSIAVLGLTFSHGETRYLAPVAPWIVVGAAVGLTAIADRVPRGARAAFWLAAAIPALLFVIELAPKTDRAFGPFSELGRRIEADRPECVLVGNVSRPSVAIIPRCVLLDAPAGADGSIELDALGSKLADVPHERQVFLLNLDDENLFVGERPTAVDLPALTAAFGLREVIVPGTESTGLRLFYAS